MYLFTINICDYILLYNIKYIIALASPHSCRNDNSKYALIYNTKHLF